MLIETDRRRGILEEQIAVRFLPIAIRGSRDPLTTPNSAALHALAERLQHVDPAGSGGACEPVR